MVCVGQGIGTLGPRVKGQRCPDPLPFCLFKQCNRFFRAGPEFAAEIVDCAAVTQLEANRNLHAPTAQGKHLIEASPVIHHIGPDLESFMRRGAAG